MKKECAEGWDGFEGIEAMKGLVLGGVASNEIALTCGCLTAFTQGTEYEFDEQMAAYLYNSFASRGMPYTTIVDAFSDGIADAIVSYNTPKKDGEKKVHTASFKACY